MAAVHLQVPPLRAGEPLHAPRTLTRPGRGRSRLLPRIMHFGRRVDVLGRGVSVVGCGLWAVGSFRPSPPSHLPYHRPTSPRTSRSDDARVEGSNVDSRGGHGRRSILYCKNPFAALCLPYPSFSSFLSLSLPLSLSLSLPLFLILAVSPSLFPSPSHLSLPPAYLVLTRVLSLPCSLLDGAPPQHAGEPRVHGRGHV